MHSGQARWQLGHRPGLDGLRGVAILLVVLSHLGVKRLEFLGGVGVTVFFTLSGFLITALLLSEHDRAGRISMHGFYRRRFFRLAPAFLLMLAVVVPIEYALTGAAPYWWTTVAEIGNWISATKGPASLNMLHHTWSLAIEEQFYLAWPLVLWGVSRRFGRRGVVVLAVSGIVLSLVAALSTDGYRLGFGTDTNASSLLAGCLLAVMMVGNRIRIAPRWTMPVVAVVVLVAFNAGWWTQHVLIPGATVLVIWTVSTRSSRLLMAKPLIGAGRISYGWYLWNFPAAMLALSYGVSMVVAAVVSLGVALASWRYVEQPILRRFSHRVEVGVRPSVAEFGGVERSPRHVHGSGLQNVSRA
ncbi:MAG: acyltransferase [Nocardioidaceae bacterium]|nr:acyltransferase [Nocardioidaceae bacterium]